MGWTAAWRQDSDTWRLDELASRTLGEGGGLAYLPAKSMRHVFLYHYQESPASLSLCPHTHPGYPDRDKRSVWGVLVPASRKGWVFLQQDRAKPTDAHNLATLFAAERQRKSPTTRTLPALPPHES